MTTVRVTFDLDELKERLDRAVELADKQNTELVYIDRATWVMARSLCTQYEQAVTA